ncbi:interleukin-1 receptor type 2 [Oryzias melastigma]|uniref:Interleukin-1 receptor type 2-like n=3 Tax=Oryzias melastigma TaxID=30732 RepID=A0A3B3DRF3_ORYME|nr:interleukin-1 receptor type 2 [Oryzias melastigma]
MVCLVLTLAAVITACVSGQPMLPPLPVKDGCHQVDSEVGIFRMEGEAVILHFPIFLGVLKARKILPPAAAFLISKKNGTDAVTYQGEGRIQQHHTQLWLLPAQTSDSGEYSCTYRNETYCVTGSIALHVFDSDSVDMAKLSYPWTATVGEELTIFCPALGSFNKSNTLIEWFKDSSLTALQASKTNFLQWDEGTLMIPAVMPMHAGLYTCQLTVLINNQHYKVSRALHVHVQDLETTPTTSKTSTTSSVGVLSSSTFSTSKNVKPPAIVSPLNGTIFESSHGSGLEMFCQVLTECLTADSTLVTWQVDDQSVESSYLSRRALQGGREVTRVSTVCQIELRLIIAEISEEDDQTEIKCVAQNMGGRQEVVARIKLEDGNVTWVIVAAVALFCFLVVVSIFLVVLFKPNEKKKKMDYFLARQSSTFSV